MRKRTTCLLLLLIPCFIQAQIGLKTGINFANVTNASSINSSNRSGFMIGAFLSPSSKGIISSRTELVYSKQGYSFASGMQTGKVDLDYIIIPQLMGINITKFFQLQFGAQMAFLINAKADSTDNSGMSGSYPSVMNYYNKFDYAFAAGAEVHPFKGLLVGARYNVGLGKLYKNLETGQKPSFSASDAKNNVVQVFIGWRFGK